jgi:hypothetical protein
MKRIRTFAIAALVSAPALLQAQIEVPRPSPRASVTQTVGTTKVTIDYHRPGVKGRTIWGGLVPYDAAWRMGANEATTISFSDPVKVNGKDVPAGTYSFFAIPSREKWTLILNKDPKQWGAYGYDAAKDQARIEVQPVTAPHSEWMRFTIDPASATSAVVNLEWEKLRIPMTIEVDVPKIVWADIDRNLAQSYELAAGYAVERGERMEDALGWIDRSIAAGETTFNLWTKARLLQKMGRAKEAVPVMERALAQARAAEMPADFMNILDSTMKSIQADAAKR